MKTELLVKMGAKVDRVARYFHKFLKGLKDIDAGFADRFGDSLRLARELWDAKSTEEKIQSLFPLTEKLFVVLRFHGLLRMFKEGVFRKMKALCKRYLKVFHTYKWFCTVEADNFIDKYLETGEPEVTAFTEEVKLFGYSRVEAEENERIRVVICKPETARRARTNRRDQTSRWWPLQNKT